MPGEGRKRGFMSDNTLDAALRSLGYSTDVVTAHGFRATARTLIVEVLDFPESVVEMQLDHAVKDANGRAYNRTAFERLPMQPASRIDELLPYRWQPGIASG